MSRRRNVPGRPFLPVTGPPAIPGYLILEVLGAGGMGIVYKARHQRLDRLVAIKMIRPEHLGQPAAVARFQREARAAARLLHPNIVTIFDADQIDGTPYLVMEFVDGMDLGRLTVEQGPLPVERACACIRQAALGLQHAHERGLVHRDIKPSNLLVSGEWVVVSGRKGEGPASTHHSPLTTHQVKLLDLGLSRLREPLDQASLTPVGEIVGTPDFVAPEQIEHPQSADIRSDLYSLGCTFYFLLAGTPPFPCGSVVEKLDAHRWRKPAPLALKQPRTPPEVEHIVMKLLAKHPQERHQNPAELAKDLEGVLGMRVEAAPLLLPESLRVDSTSTPQVTKNDDVAAPYCWRGHSAPVTSLAYSSDGVRIVSGDKDGRLVLWDGQCGQELADLRGHGGAIDCVRFSPDGKFLVWAGGDGNIRIADPNSAQELRRLSGQAGVIRALAVTPDGRWLFTAGDDPTVWQWNLARGRKVRRLGGMVAERHWDAILALALSADGELALSGSKDRNMLLWSVANGRQVQSYRGHPEAVGAVALTPDARLALAASGDRLHIWSVSTGQLLHVLAGHAGIIRDIDVAANGRWAVSAGDDATVRVWDLAEFRQVDCFCGHGGPVLCVAAAPDGLHVAAGTADGAVFVWEVRPHSPALPPGGDDLRSR